MNYKIFLLFIAGTVIAASCTKDDNSSSFGKAQTSVSLTNANGSAKSVDFFIDGVKSTVISAVGVNSTITGTYVGISDATSHNIVVKDAASGNAELFNGTVTTVPGNSYTFIAYDTLKAGKINGILLASNRSIPVNNVGTSNVRFLNLSSKSPALDLWMVRRVGTTLKDSVLIASRPNLGGVTVPDVATLSAFTSVKASEVAGSAGAGSAATDYLIRLKLAGTTTIVSTSAATPIIPSRNYTIFARGTYPASAVTVLLNN